MAALSRFLLALLTALAILRVVDVAVDATLPRTERLADDFSARYLNLRITERSSMRQVLVFGDSTLWGYGVSPDQNAVSQLSKLGIDVKNLSFLGGSPSNTKALVDYLLQRGVRPRAVLFNVNLKELNPLDAAYANLVPAVAQLTTKPASLGDRLERIIERCWLLYGYRSDIRAMIFGSTDAASALAYQLHNLSGESARYRNAHRPTEDRFIGTYDLSPIGRDNAEANAAIQTVLHARAADIPVYVLLTPTNHRLLHDLIDVPEYYRNINQISRMLQSAGAHVLNYDDAFLGNLFIDNDHLNARGNAILAKRLQQDLR